MFNYAKLLGRIKEKCNTQVIFAEKMGLSSRSVSLKLTQKTEFSQSEIMKALEVLDLKPEEIAVYFFCTDC
jgi:hypothetical protein